jgi:hypothetical protein
VHSQQPSLGQDPDTAAAVLVCDERRSLRAHRAGQDSVCREDDGW